MGSYFADTGVDPSIYGPRPSNLSNLLLDSSLSLFAYCICIYIYVHIHTHILYVCIYTERERARGREGEREREETEREGERERERGREREFLGATAARIDNVCMIIQGALNNKALVDTSMDVLHTLHRGGPCEFIHGLLKCCDGSHKTKEDLSLSAFSACRRLHAPRRFRAVSAFYGDV